MLAGLLLAGLVATPLATLALFTRSPVDGRTAGAWPATRRLLLSVVATVVLAAVVAGALDVFGARPVTLTAAGLVAVAGSVVAASILLAPTGQRVVSPNPLTPARGHHPSPVVHTSGPTTAPTTAPTTTAPTTAPPSATTTS